MKYITIIAHARSGSTYLCQLLGRFNEIKSYLELFHYDLNQIKHYVGADWSKIQESLFLPSDNVVARNLLVENHQKYLNILSNLHPDKIVTFKIFPGHLPSNRLIGVIQGSCFCLLLRRNLLQTYISNVISIKLQKWSLVDTSNEKIIFSSDDFIAHLCRITWFYQQAKRNADELGIPLFFLDYEDIVASDAPWILVTNILNGLIKQESFNLDRIQIINKQDRRKLAVDKVINTDEMLAFLEDNDLLILNDETKNIDDSMYLKIIEAYKHLK